MSDISGLIGGHVWRVDAEKSDPDLLVLHLTNGKVASFRHHQDCCEKVYLAAVYGDIENLLGAEISDVLDYRERRSDGIGAYTMTYYDISTSKGTFVLRFDGESSGYHSEEDHDLDVHFIIENAQ